MSSNKNELDPMYMQAKRQLRTLFVIGTVVVMFIVIMITVISEWVVLRSGMFDDEALLQTFWFIPALAIGFTGACVGVLLFYVAGKTFLQPMNDMVYGMSKLAKGEYDTRLEFRGPEVIKRIYKSFNTLAQELAGIEILRSEFVNNFSHEFKTPIMSINGLIGLIKNNDLPREKQIEYLNVIEEETDRLAMITTNVLNMSRLENQGILTDVKKYNVSEQIRMCVLLTERQWTQKKLNLTMDFDEYEINANEEMLKQVWLNILDNAIKFSDEGGELSVDVLRGDEGIVVKIGNTGKEIDEKDREKIFNKFYRTDDAHTVSGNGIGLSIVKRIVDLHGGEVYASREGDKTVFTVMIPV